MALTAKQAAFVAEYLIDLNATQAAIRAGYSKKTANEQASRLLANVNVAAAVTKAKVKRQARTEITQDSVVRELAKLGFADIRKAVNWGSKPSPTDDPSAREYPVELVSSEEMDDDTAAAVSEVALTAQGVKIKMHDKRAALESLLRHLGGLGEDEDVPKLAITIKAEQPIGDIRVTRSNG